MEKPRGAILAPGSAGKSQACSGKILGSFLAPVVTIPRPISTARYAQSESSRSFTISSLIKLQSESECYSIVITTAMGLLLPVKSCPRLRSSSASQGSVPRRLKILGSRICHFCSIGAMRSTMNESTCFRPLSSASSTLAWNSPRDIQCFLIASQGRIQSSVYAFLSARIKIVSTGASDLRTHSLVTAKISRH